MDDVMEALLRGSAIAAIRLSRIPETVTEFEDCLLSTYRGLDDAHLAEQRKVLELALREARAQRPLGVATCLDEIRRLTARLDASAIPDRSLEP